MAEDAADNPGAIEFAGVRFEPDRVIELDGAQVMVNVPRSDIRRIALRHGFYSAHPVIQVGAGIVLTAIGILPTMHLSHWLVQGGTFYGPEAFLVSFVFLGPWLVYDATKRGPHLDVQTTAGRRKLILDKKTVGPEQLDAFLAVVEDRLGYRIDRATDGAERPGR